MILISSSCFQAYHFRVPRFTWRSRRLATLVNSHYTGKRRPTSSYQYQCMSTSGTHFFSQNEASRHFAASLHRSLALTQPLEVQRRPLHPGANTPHVQTKVGTSTLCQKYLISVITSALASGILISISAPKGQYGLHV